MSVENGHHPGGPRQRPAKVLLVEDHALLAESLRYCLVAEGYDVAVAPVVSHGSVLDAARAHFPDVVLLDIDLGKRVGDGSDLVAPLTALGAKVVVVSGTTVASRVAVCLEQGAVGFVPKSTPVDELVAAVDDVLAQQPLLSEEERANFFSELEDHRKRSAGLDRLTRREAAILAGLMEGKPVAAMAAEAYVSEGTVRSQIRAILTKLDVNSQLAAVAVARRAGWSPSN